MYISDYIYISGCNVDFNNQINHFPIDLEQQRTVSVCGSKSIGKWYIQSDFGKFNKDQKSISLCVEYTAAFLYLPLHTEKSY